ncbi:MAG: TetR family transcriptional regulator [endosymbiont of Galathealinum brachiosum]|uniref:TetR family transcriptional regulator n=1 Tax=endosymbiont of Galathealinum brachiosum TaxID=2200906 RepID=A0A370DM45_9GAMM|nr:MAG: TetR family transcriptional regulator [endosymbiont of Galathealinum brachiosum]
MSRSHNQADMILDTALLLADNCGWESLRLHDVAERIDIPLSRLHMFYRQKDDLVEAWYDRADQSMLKTAEPADFLNLNKASRIHSLIMAWLDELAKHKTVSRDMLLYKLEPAHLHLQVLGVLRVSRTVQWFLEAAHSQTTHLSRIAEEIGLTSLYLLTFSYWVMDRSQNQRNTREFLRRRLQQSRSIAELFDMNIHLKRKSSDTVVDIKTRRA